MDCLKTLFKIIFKRKKQRIQESVLKICLSVSVLSIILNLIAFFYFHFVFSSSSLVLKILKDAYNAGKKFRVVVVDSRPKFEGKFCSLWQYSLNELMQTFFKISSAILGNLRQPSVKLRTFSSHAVHDDRSSQNIHRKTKFNTFCRLRVIRFAHRCKILGTLVASPGFCGGLTPFYLEVYYFYVIDSFHKWLPI